MVDGLGGGLAGRGGGGVMLVVLIAVGWTALSIVTGLFVARMLWLRDRRG